MQPYFVETDDGSPDTDDLHEDVIVNLMSKYQVHIGRKETIYRLFDKQENLIAITDDDGKSIDVSSLNTASLCYCDYINTDNDTFKNLFYMMCVLNMIYILYVMTMRYTTRKHFH